jgi:hypothetical protein
MTSGEKNRNLTVERNAFSALEWMRRRFWIYCRFSAIRIFVGDVAIGVNFYDMSIDVNIGVDSGTEIVGFPRKE